MITLAFAQMAYYLVLSLRALGSDDGLTLSVRPSLGFLESRPRRSVLLRGAGDPARGAGSSARIAQRAARPGAAGHSRQRDAHGGDRLSHLPPQAARLRHRRRGGRPGRRAFGQPQRAGRAQPAALDRVRTADDHGDPGRRRPAAGRCPRRRRAADRRRGDRRAHDPLAARHRRGAARRGAVRARGPLRPGAAMARQGGAPTT